MPSLRRRIRSWFALPQSVARKPVGTRFRPTLELLEDRRVPAMVTDFLTGDADLANLRSAFVAEGRIGSSAYPGQNFTFEIDVNSSTAGPFGPGQTADVAWQTSAANPFT